MSVAGGVSTLIWALIVIIIIVVVVVVLFKVINLLYIAPIITNEVSATPAAYTETVGHVSQASGFVVSLTPIPSFSII